jgi:hypothetical protein
LNDYGRAELPNPLFAGDSSEINGTSTTPEPTDRCYEIGAGPMKDLFRKIE